MCNPVRGSCRFPRGGNSGMNYEEAVQYIHTFFQFGAKNGFENISRLLAEYGNPQDTLQFIHIAGTNGKGSVTAMSASVLRQAGYRVGMYISPYVIRFNERIQVDGEMIPDEDLAQLTTELSQTVDRLFDEQRMITQFEFITALAMIYFARRGCQVVCLEVGMGGRLDPTNVIPKSLVSVIMSISLDHTKILGDTVDKIAFEKCGILKQNGVAVSYPCQDPKALAVIMEQCALKNNRLVIPGAASIQVLEETIFGSEILYQGNRYRIPLAGRHQIYNASVVVEVVKLLREQGFSLPQEAVEEGLEKTRFPARQELLCRQPLVILDGAHNASGAQSLISTLQKIPAHPRVGIVGVLSSKDYQAVADATVSYFDQLFTVKPEDKPGTAGLHSHVLADYIRTLGVPVDQCASEEEALSRALEAAGPQGALVIYGSLYLASTMREIILKKLEKDQKLI